MTSDEGRKKLLDIVRTTLEQSLAGQLTKIEDPEMEELDQTGCGVFVTLKNHGDLRGCIGCFSSEIKLWKLVSQYAIESSKDSRFYSNPVALKELSEIDIEISVLSPYKKVESYKEAVLGKHGIIVESGFRRGVFLPQVATETGWSLEKFWGMCCLHKAGLMEDAYLDSEVKLYTFEAEVFGENEE